MSDLDRFRTALESPTAFVSLRDVVTALIDTGRTRESLVAELEILRETLTEETHEDVVLDLMDYLTGWCSPGKDL
jgi:hypothetical protein